MENKKMKILITGNLGYVGPVVENYLIKKIKKAQITGLDTFFFKNNLVNFNNKTQIYDDIRNIKKISLKQFDAIIHLAAVSNDPIGNKFENATKNINYEASTILLKEAIKNNVKKFVFASSCSIYGFNDGSIKNENSTVYPLTEYARSKVNFEKFAKKINLKKTQVTCLRFPTACGMSPNLRLDLVINDFVFSAINKKKIKILSDGTPWRPIIHVKDMAKAIEWSLKRKNIKKSEPLCINVGLNKNNFKVIDMALKIKKKIKGISVSVNKKKMIDKRSYQVSFDWFLKLAPKKFHPTYTIDKIITDLTFGIKKYENVRNRKFHEYFRLHEIQKLIDQNKINKLLRWK